jgi:hypothetical protein
VSGDTKPRLYLRDSGCVDRIVVVERRPGSARASRYLAHRRAAVAFSVNGGVGAGRDVEVVENVMAHPLDETGRQIGSDSPSEVAEHPVNEELGVLANLRRHTDRRQKSVDVQSGGRSQSSAAHRS